MTPVDPQEIQKELERHFRAKFPGATFTCTPAGQTMADLKADLQLIHRASRELWPRCDFCEVLISNGVVHEFRDSEKGLLQGTFCSPCAVHRLKLELVRSHPRVDEMKRSELILLWLESEKTARVMLLGEGGGKRVN
jgi:hypothetical protein